jgi:hypothetical protein
MELEKEMGRVVLGPTALDDSWKCSKSIEQIMEYNILISRYGRIMAN